MGTIRVKHTHIGNHSAQSESVRAEMRAKVSMGFYHMAKWPFPTVDI